MRITLTFWWDPAFGFQNIILRSSLIQIILDGVFNGMDNLMSLDLEDNLLISMPALDDVMDTLGSLNLMKNKIKEVPNNYFDNFTSLHSLSIQENEISTLPPDSVRALDFFHAFDFHGNKIEALECGTFARMSRLEYVTMYHNWLSSFPCFGVIHEDARITSIDLNSNEISQITEDEVSHLIYLRYLDLNYNMISNGSFIKAIPSLRVIRMTHNRMVSLLTIDSMIPRPVPLQDMVEVWVDSNNLVEFPCISALAQYSEISLHSNYLHIYPPRCLAGLSNCSHLYLGNNKATEFPDFSLLFQNTLQVLELHENDISSVPLAHIQNLRSLRRLTLHNNDIPVLPDMTFAVETLTDFDIDNNNLQDLDPVLADYGVWKIGDWDIDHNDITYILQDLLHQMKSLYRLNAYMNKLTDLPHLTAVGKTLTWATFKHNKISHIPTGSLSGMVVLEYLNLEYNLIALFPFEMIGSMPRLRSLHLGHNKLTTVPYLSHLPEKAGLVVTIYNNYIECTKDICWMRNFDKFGLLRETYLCKDHPVFSSHVFNDLTDDQMDCYCK